MHVRHLHISWNWTICSISRWDNHIVLNCIHMWFCVQLYFRIGFPIKIMLSLPIDTYVLVNDTFTAIDTSSRDICVCIHAYQRLMTQYNGASYRITIQMKEERNSFQKNKIQIWCALSEDVQFDLIGNIRHFP